MVALSSSSFTGTHAFRHTPNHSRCLSTIPYWPAPTPREQIEEDSRVEQATIARCRARVAHLRELPLPGEGLLPASPSRVLPGSIRLSFSELGDRLGAQLGIRLGAQLAAQLAARHGLTWIIPTLLFRGDVMRRSSGEMTRDDSCRSNPSAATYRAYNNRCHE